MQKLLHARIILDVFNELELEFIYSTEINTYNIFLEHKKTARRLSLRLIKYAASVRATYNGCFPCAYTAYNMFYIIVKVYCHRLSGQGMVIICSLRA